MTMSAELGWGDSGNPWSENRDHVVQRKEGLLTSSGSSSVPVGVDVSVENLFREQVVALNIIRQSLGRVAERSDREALGRVLGVTSAYISEKGKRIYGFIQDYSLSLREEGLATHVRDIVDSYRSVLRIFVQQVVKANQERDIVQCVYDADEVIRDAPSGLAFRLGIGARALSPASPNEDFVRGDYSTEEAVHRCTASSVAARQLCHGPIGG